MPKTLVKKFLQVALLVMLLMIGIAQSATIVNLTGIAASSGQAGNHVSLVGNGFPSCSTLSPSNVTVTLTPTAGGSPVNVNPVLSVNTMPGTFCKIVFAVPSAPGGTYNVGFSDPTDDGGVSSGNTESFTVIAPATVSVSGTVVVQVPAPGAPLASPPASPVGLAGVTLTLSPGGLMATTNASGQYTISGVSAGPYTLTPSGGVPAGDSVTFYPPSLPVTVSSSNVTGENFGAQPGYKVTGTFSYEGKQSKPGQAFIKLQAPDGPVCLNCPTQGTSVELTSLGSSTTVTKAFTVNSVPPGVYTGQAWYDIVGFGSQDNITGVGNINLPFATPFTVTVTAGDVAVGTVTLTDPATPGNVSPASPDIPLVATISQIDNGIVIHYPSVLVGGVEQALGYNLNWSSVSPSDCQAGPTTTSGGGLNVGKDNTLFEESGNLIFMDGDNTDSLFYKFSPVAKKPAVGQLWFFCMQGVNGNGVGGTFYNVACSPSAPNCTPNTGYGQVTLAHAPTSSGAGTSTVTMNVTLPGFTPYTGTGVNINGPMYTGCYDPGTKAFYSASVPAATLTGPDGQPGTTTAVSVFSVPNTANCTPFAGVNNDNDGLFSPSSPYSNTASVSYAGAGDLYNLGRGPLTAPGATPITPPALISSTTTFNVDLTAYSENSVATLTTQSFAAYTDQNGVAQPQNYAVNFNEQPLVAFPATVQLQTPSPKVNSLMDFAASKDDFFTMSLSTGPLGLQPQVGDSYNLVSSSENTLLTPYPDMWGSASTTCTGGAPCPLTVTGLNTSFPTGLAATSSDTPMFSWSGTSPFQFTLTNAAGTVLWQVPKSLPTYYPLTSASITYPNDPTGAGNSAPTASLTSGTTYVWSVTGFDANGNLATQRAIFTAP